MKDNKLIDLHTHTIYSDGDLTPIQLINLAKENNIGVISITDHDTISGYRELTNDLDDNLKIIKGIELSAKVNKGKMHILGYNIDTNNHELNQRLKELENDSIEYFLNILYWLEKEYQISFNKDEIENILNTGGNLGKIDVSKLLIKYDYAKTIQDAFNYYLAYIKEKTKHLKKELLYDECLELILKSGGVPVLAHPNTLKLDKKSLLILIKEMIKNGLEGIEVYHSKATLEETSMYLEIANLYDLLISGGSDYHGLCVKPDIFLGSGKNNNLKIKSLSILDKIK